MKHNLKIVKLNINSFNRYYIHSILKNYCIKSTNLTKISIRIVLICLCIFEIKYIELNFK